MLDEIVAKEMGRLSLQTLKQAALIEALREEVAKLTKEIAVLKGEPVPMPMPEAAKSNGAVGAAH